MYVIVRLLWADQNIKGLKRIFFKYFLLDNVKQACWKTYLNENTFCDDDDDVDDDDDL